MSNALQAVQDRERQLLEGAQKVVYKLLDDGTELNAWVFFPSDDGLQEDRTGVLLFYSSGWDQGRPTQFAPHAMYLAGRGAVAVLVDYRTASSHGAQPIDAVKDARSAVRWMRIHSKQLGVDPDKIVFAGGAAGAHAGAATTMLPELPDDDTDPLDVSSVPNALVMYSPIIEVEKNGYGWSRFPSAKEVKDFSLFNGLDRGIIPIQIFCGSNDRLVPYQIAEKFASKMKRKKNVCEFLRFDGRDHSFFNLNVDPVGYEAAIGETDRFLVEHGFLEASEEIDESRLESWREPNF